jgi:LPXTG-motif cell wall-anchored protein
MRTRISWLFALLSAMVLMAGTVGFAGAASATPGNGNGNAMAHARRSSPPPSPLGRPKATTTPRLGPHSRTAKRGGSTAKTGTSANDDSTRGGTSGVSLPKPNRYQAQADPDGMENGGVDQPGGTGGVNTSAQDGNNGSGNDIDCEDDNRGQGVPGHCKPRRTACAEEHGHGNGHARGRAKECDAAQGPRTPEVAGTPGATWSPPAGSDAAPLGMVPTQAALPAGSASAASADLPPQGTLAEVLGVEAFASAAGATSTNIAAEAATGATLGGNRLAPGVAGVQASVGPMMGLLPNTGAGKALLAATAIGLIALAAGGALMLRHRFGAAG